MQEPCKYILKPCFVTPCSTEMRELNLETVKYSPKEQRKLSAKQYAFDFAQGHLAKSPWQMRLQPCEAVIEVGDFDL